MAGNGLQIYGPVAFDAQVIFCYNMLMAIMALLLKLATAEPEMDARATECRFDDYACLVEHDRRVLDMALMTADFGLCKRAVAERRCFEEFNRFDWGN